MRVFVACYLVVALCLACGSGEGTAGSGSAGAGGGAGSSGGLAGGKSGGPSAGTAGQGSVEPTACGPALVGSRCLQGGWCFDGPTPQGSEFQAIDGVADGTSIWAVGSHGGAFRYCEGKWRAMDSGSEVILRDVWHPNADFAMAVGDQGTILSWDGRRWTTLDSPIEQTLYAVWGSAPDDVWIGGAYDEEGVLLLHFDGTAFTRVPDIGMLDSDIYAITGHGNLPALCL